LCVETNVMTSTSGEEEKERHFKEILKRLLRVRVLEESRVFFNMDVSLFLIGKGLESAWWIIVRVLQERDSDILIIKELFENWDWRRKYKSRSSERRLKLWLFFNCLHVSKKWGQRPVLIWDCNLRGRKRWVVFKMSFQNKEQFYIIGESRIGSRARISLRLCLGK